MHEIGRLRTITPEKKKHTQSEQDRQDDDKTPILFYLMVLLEWKKKLTTKTSLTYERTK